MTESESWRNVGKRIRKLRKESQLTIQQLAAGCDLSSNAISLVERGKVAPTVITLCKIAHALGVSASSFFQEICPTEVILTRAVDQTESAIDTLIGSNFSMPSFAGQGTACSLSSQQPQVVFCIYGSIQYEVDDHYYLLTPGDSLTINGEALHRWRNSSNDTGVAVIVFTHQSDPNNQEGE